MRNKNKKEEDNGKKTVKVFGFKMSTDNFAGLIICAALGIMLLGWSTYKNYELKYGYNVIVDAKIIDIYWEKA